MMHRIDECEQAILRRRTDMHLGEVTGVAVNSKGNIVVLSRANTSGPAYAAAAAQLLEFVPVGERALRRRTAQLARAEAGSAPEEVGFV